MTPERQQAALLLRKAREDRDALGVLAAERSIADASVGFHAQQAVEKALKGVLAARGVDFPWTHDLQLLIRELDAAELEVPHDVREARRLAPWAVEYRYGEVIDETLDREATLVLVDAVLKWANAATELPPQP